MLNLLKWIGTVSATGKPIVSPTSSDSSRFVWYFNMRAEQQYGMYEKSSDLHLNMKYVSLEKFLMRDPTISQLMSPATVAFVIFFSARQKFFATTLPGTYKKY